MANIFDKLKSFIPQGSPEMPEMDRALTHVYREMPNEVSSMAKKGRKVRPMNAVERLLYASRGVAAYTTPWGNIPYDAANMKAAMLQPEDVMAHELTHVGQIDREGGALPSFIKTLTRSVKPYGDRDFEKEAFDREFSRMGRRTRKHDIKLGSK